MKKSSINGPAIAWQTVSHNQMVRYWKHSKTLAISSRRCSTSSASAGRYMATSENTWYKVPSFADFLQNHLHSDDWMLERNTKMGKDVHQWIGWREHVCAGNHVFFFREYGKIRLISLQSSWEDSEIAVNHWWESDSIRCYPENMQRRNLELATDGTMTIMTAICGHQRVWWATGWQDVTNMPPIIPSDGLIVDI